MNILALYVLKISSKVFENQVKMPYVYTPPPKAERFATSMVALWFKFLRSYFITQKSIPKKSFLPLD